MSQQQLQRQQQIAQLQKENQVFYEAYKTGKITYSEYSQAMNFQNRQLERLLAGQAPLQPETQRIELVGPVPATSAIQPPNIQEQISRFQATQQSIAAARSLGLPEELGRQYDLRNVQVPQGSKVTGYELIPFVGPFKNESDRPAPSLSIKYEQTPTSREAELAAAERDLLNFTQRGTGMMQGTRTTTGTGKNPSLVEYNTMLAKYSPETKTALEQQQQAKAFNVVKNTALGVGSIIALPIVGPTGALVGAGGGLAISQGIKTVSQSMAGEKLTLLTGAEAFEAATSGVVLTGAGRLLSSGLQVAAKGGSNVAKALAEGVGQTGSTVKAVTAAASRVGQNALIGGGANFVLSGGDLKATGEGALFGAGLGAFGEAAGGLSQRLLGVKAKEIAKYTEATRTETVGKTTVTQRIGTIETKNVRIPYQEAMRIQKQLDTVGELTLELAGSKRTTTISKDISGIPEQVTTFGAVKGLDSVRILEGDLGTLRKQVLDSNIGQQATATRKADPIISALKGERFEAGKVAQIKIETPTGTVKGVQSTKISTGEGNILEVGGKATASKPSTFLEQKTVTNRELPTQTKSTLATFDKIQLRGTLKDDAAAFDFVKNLDDTLAQKIYKEQGGGYRDITGTVNRAINPVTAKSSAMKPGSNEFFRKTTSTIDEPLNKVGKAVLEGTTKQTGTGKGTSINIERPVVKLDFSKGSAWLAVGSPKSVWSSVSSKAATAQETKQQQAPSLKLNLSPMTTTAQAGKTESANRANLDNVVGLNVMQPQINLPNNIVTTEGVTRRDPLRGGTPVLDIPRPVMFDNTKEDNRLGGGFIPVDLTKPMQESKPITKLGEGLTPIQKQPADLIRLPDTTQPQPQDIAQVVRTGIFQKRKLQGLMLFPGGGNGKDLGMFSNRKGLWWITRNALPNPDQVFKQVLGKKSVNVFKQVQTKRSGKKRR
jgi:hypothetical protein